MSNLLYISPVLHKDERTGGTLVREINKQIISEYSANFDSYLIKLHNSKLKKAASTIMGFKCGLTNQHIRNILKLIYEKRIHIVFIDGSLYGGLVKAIRTRCNDISIIVFFHNCEYKIYSDSLRNKNRLLQYFLLKSVADNEIKTLCHSTINIFLSERDFNTCKNQYTITKKIDKEYSPIALVDEMKNDIEAGPKITPHILLFVGAYFFANINGLLWFDKNVLPYIDYKLVIVGKKIEQDQFRDKLISRDKIITKGFVADLNNEYKNADIVINPVFEGSGMKTKTAECFMYGKTLVSSSEGLVGYDTENIHNIYVCNTAEEFIVTLSALKQRKIFRFNPEIRDLFIKKYSKDSRRSFFFNLLGRFDT